MWWNFKKGKPKGELRIERIQVAWYDMEHNVIASMNLSLRMVVMKKTY